VDRFSNHVRKITHEATNQLQIIVSAMEMGESKIVLNACKRIRELTEDIRLEVLGVSERDRQDRERAG